MIIVYLRASSLGGWSYCPQQYFIQNVLGYEVPPNPKTIKGSIVHKALEIFAGIKLQLQNISSVGSDFGIYEDDQIGIIDFTDPKELLYEYKLTDQEVEQVNKDRKNKYVYITPSFIEKGHTRYGVQLVENVVDKVFEYYDNGEFTATDKKDCLNWVWIVLDYMNGMYDCRKKKIVEVEKFFDIEIDKPWAKYNYTLANGEEVAGNLHIKGTTDLLFEPDDGILEVLDYKTGQRMDWASGKIKTPEMLQEDPQLMLYYWAMKQLYPQYKGIILTIFFVRHGGPFSIVFDDSHYEKIERIVESKFKEIQNCELPRLLDPSQRDFRCNKLCPFAHNKLNPQDKTNTCHQIHEELKKYGMDYVVSTRSKKGHIIGTYNAPGE